MPPVATQQAVREVWEGLAVAPGLGRGERNRMTAHVIAWPWPGGRSLNRLNSILRWGAVFEPSPATPRVSNQALVGTVQAVQHHPGRHLEPEYEARAGEG